MIDITSLIPQISRSNKQSAPVTSLSEDLTFDSVLSQKTEDVASMTDISQLDEFINTNDSIPAEMKATIKQVINGAPIEKNTLKGLCKKIASLTKQTAMEINLGRSGVDTVKSEIDMQVLTYVSFHLIENYGQTSVLDDLTYLWRNLDVRTDAYKSLIEGLKGFIKTKCCDFHGVPNITESERKKRTWEMQYQLWEMISVYGITERSQPLLQTFNTENQMASAKVDLKGQKIDSLIDSIAPKIEIDF